MHTLRHHPGARGSRRGGFTLIESLIAASILAGIMIAISSAVTAAHQNAFEAQQRIAAALATEELMSRLAAVAYGDLPGWHGFREEVGMMVDGGGQPLPDSQAMVGREVTVTSMTLDLPIPTVRVRGLEVRVTSFDQSNRVLADVVRFVPEPSS